VVQLGSAGAFTLGIGVTAYTLGMRHGFDADHVAAIDNATRKLMSEGKRPLSVGHWFSLGHSTIVFGHAFPLSVGIRSLAGRCCRGARPAAVFSSSFLPTCGDGVDTGSLPKVQP
jgi:high-affinity nickel permease